MHTVEDENQPAKNGTRTCETDAPDKALAPEEAQRKEEPPNWMKVCDLLCDGLGFPARVANATGADGYQSCADKQQRQAQKQKGEIQHLTRPR